MADGIKTSDSNFELNEFLNKGPKKRVHIPGLFGPWDDSNVFSLKSYVGREIVVEKNYWPARLNTSFDWRKAIGRKTERDITGI